MKTETVLKAIDALKKANDALMLGNLGIAQQIKLGGECFSAAFHLRAELEKAIPEVEISE